MIDIAKIRRIVDIEYSRIVTSSEIFHDGSQERVKESLISNDPVQAIHQFMDFIQEKISR